jgi:hypothetical protein
MYPLFIDLADKALQSSMSHHAHPTYDLNFLNQRQLEMT